MENGNGDIISAKEKWDLRKMGCANRVQQNGAMTENESQKWMTLALALNQRVNAA